MTENNDILSTNVLIIGKSGAGKSSLLNYLFDSKIQETGVGAPVTAKGIFPHEYHLDESTVVNVYDTWGLEADKAEEWKELVSKEIESHEAGSLKDWFHTIIYCINANTDRIEDFEIDFISSLLHEGNNLVVVLTHCDIGRTKNTIEGIKRALREKAVLSENILEVSNEEKKLIGGKSTKRFGREEVWERIKKSLWDKIVEKYPKRLRNEAMRMLAVTKLKCFELTDKSIKLGKIRSDKNYQKLNEECNALLTAYEKNVNELYQKNLTEAVDYYNRIFDRFFDGASEKEERNARFGREYMSYNMDKEAKMLENFDIGALVIIPVVGAVVPFVIADAKRDQYKTELNKHITRLVSELENDEEKLRDFLKQMLKE